MSRHGCDGATLIELVVTIGVLALVSVAAVPGLGAMRRDAVRTATLNDFLHSLYIARNESIMRNSVISICRSRNGINCANAAPNWNDGWIVFENRDRDQPADTDPGEPILYRRGPLDGGTLTSTRSSFSYRPYLQADVNGTILYCP